MTRRAPNLYGRRATFLSMLLSLLVVGCLLFGLFVICGGLSLYVGAVLLGVTGIGFLHYVLWGHSLSEQVAEEREQKEDAALLEDDDWAANGSHDPRRRFPR